MLPLFCAQGCGKRVSFLPEGEFCWVVGNEIIFCQDLVDTVPPEGERGLGTFDPIGETEKIVEDSSYLVHSVCGDARPQVGLGCRKTREHFSEARCGDV